ncbi:MAG: cytochrome-c oxidase, cbb3-type subunit III [Alphaproteobacteria bacterium]|nr:cytochrome-c oxidase, cbb3-type subunit III [Alphaproteobacteria bacterium]
MTDKQKNEHEKDIDHVTGVETTGHEWDGLKELNNPLPRWWVWVFIVCIVWSIWYFVIYPAWPVPGGATEGTGGYTQYKELAESQAEITARQEAYLERFEDASFQDILKDPELYAFASAGGAAAFKDNCATCHGTGGAGAKGYPNLNDDDWLWGGTLEDIHQTLEYGVRANNLDTRISQMPAFGKDGLLKREEINAVVDYVLSLSGGKTDGHEAQGAEIFKMQCASCHGADGKGLQEFGAPNLTDKIWLYGGDRQTIFETVYYARAGMMPAWGTRLDENTIKQLTIYLHELGGGE